MLGVLLRAICNHIILILQLLLVGGGGSTQTLNPMNSLVLDELPPGQRTVPKHATDPTKVLLDLCFQERFRIWGLLIGVIWG